MTPPQLFGTDGIRAPFGAYPLDRATVTALGCELGAHLARQSAEPPTVVLGGDTRFSTPELCGWLAAGLAESGTAVEFLGTVPTPAVVHVVRQLGAQAGVSVSASHNPWRDNGIKLIGGDGFKWSVADERSLEQRLLASGANKGPASAPPLVPNQASIENYSSWLRNTLPAGRPLAGLKIALDAANGAAAELAGPLFDSLGARTTVLNAEPDGRNINRDCGSTHPEALCALVADGGYDLGVAFDGDADRALLVDEQGSLRDGDATLYLWAKALLQQGRLEPPTIVVTSMSNLGLERALAALGIDVTRCAVGDRWVVEALRRDRLILGGEQSGHIINLELSTTGDGLLTAMQIAHLLVIAGLPCSELLAGFSRFPQILKNIEVASKPPLDELPTVRSATEKAERELGADGRIVLRYSGTEPLARVMIEGPDQAVIEELANSVLAAIAVDLEVSA